jgi:hypothetical protein
LHLIGEPETLALPNNYLEAMKGINAITDSLLQIRPNFAKPPTGNTVFHTLGGFLFEAINNSEQGSSFDRGKAQAFITVAKIFSAKARSTDFDPLYLASFYRGIEQV